MLITGTITNRFSLINLVSLQSLVEELTYLIDCFRLTYILLEHSFEPILRLLSYELILFCRERESLGRLYPSHPILLVNLSY